MGRPFWGSTSDSSKPAEKMDGSQKVNHYQVLGLNHDCTDDELKKAYRQLALVHHPDKNEGSTEATEKFKVVIFAFLALNASQELIMADTKCVRNFERCRSSETVRQNLGQ